MREDIMSFKAEIDLAYKDFLTWIKVNAKTSHKVLNIITTVFIVIALLSMSAGVIILIVLDAIESDMIFMICIFTVCMIYLLLKNRISAKISQKRFAKGVGTIRLSVNDEGIRADTNKSEEKYFFGGITAFYSTKAHFFILLDKNHALIVPKHCFTEGEPDAFADFICEKTGLENKFIKC